MNSGLPPDLPAVCCHCGGLIDNDPGQGWLLVQCGTRSRRCPGAEVTTEAVLGAVAL